MRSAVYAGGEVNITEALMVLAIIVNLALTMMNLKLYTEFAKERFKSSNEREAK